MHVIKWRPLKEFIDAYPDAETPLEAWYDIAEKACWRNFGELRATYPHADQVGKFTVFNIGGNKYRLIAAIHFNRQKVFVRHILTHEEYDRGDWKDD